MRFSQHYSSSSGNLYTVEAANGKRLIIDPGVTWKKLQVALNYDLSNIIGTLCSHEHLDHSKAVKDVMKAGIDVFASLGTFEALELNSERRAKVIGDKDVIGFNGDFRVRVFSTNHDAIYPLGFVVHEIATKENLLFATDTSYITQHFNFPFSIIAIECSYNREYLQKRVDQGKINEDVAKRLLTSHLEEKETLRYLEKFCDLSKCREIHLLHMSADTINKERVKANFKKKLFIEVRIVESGK